MFSHSIEKHCRELDRCNQRGGRMLSVADLIEADTMPLALAAAVTACVASGASFMVGANPGGAGKTTVMCALLNFIPADVDIVPATPKILCQATTTSSARRCCYLCHEIGSGPYYAYLWGQALRQYCSLGDKGHILATNLHADTLAETEEQVCGVNQVPRNHFHNFPLLLFLRVSHSSRVIQQTYISNDGAPHALAYDASQGLFKPKMFATSEKRQICQQFLENFLAQPDRTIEAMRRAALNAPALAEMFR